MIRKYVIPSQSLVDLSEDILQTAQSGPGFDGGDPGSGGGDGGSDEWGNTKGEVGFGHSGGSIWDNEW